MREEFSTPLAGYILTAGNAGTLDEAPSSVLTSVAQARRTPGYTDFTTRKFVFPDDEQISIVIATGNRRQGFVFVTAWRIRDNKILSCDEIVALLPQTIAGVERDFKANARVDITGATAFIVGALLLIAWILESIFLGVIPMIAQSNLSLIAYIAATVAFCVGIGFVVGLAFAHWLVPRRWHRSDLGRAVWTYAQIAKVPVDS